MEKTKTSLHAIIQNMKLFIKKWWLLENLREEINRHSQYQSMEEVSSGRIVLLSPKFFIAGNKDKPEYPGLAEKSFWWKKKYSEDKLKKRIKINPNRLRFLSTKSISMPRRPRGMPIRQLN